MNLKSPRLAVVILLACSWPSSADSNDGFQFFQEEAKVVTASRREQPISESPVAVDVITSDEIRASAATSIADLMRFQPGVDVVDGHTTHGNRSLVSVRGFEEGFARNVLVLVDGRNVYDAASGGVYWDQLPVQLQDVERIEIIRGPNAALYGSGAGLGVINIITKTPAGPPSASLQSAGGNRDSVLMSEAVESSLRGFDFRVSHSFQQQGGFDNVSGGVGNDFTHSNKANLRSHWSPSAGTDLELFTGGTWSNQGIPNISTAHDEFSQHFEMVKLRIPTSNQSHLEFLTSRNDYIYTIDPTVVGDSDRARSYQYNESILHQIDWGNGRLNSTYGFDHQYVHAYSRHEYNDDPDVKNAVGRGFLNQTARVGSYLTLVGAAAWEATDLTKPHLNYQASTIVAPVENQTFRVSYSEASTIPTLRLVNVDEQVGPSVTRIGNSSIRPEKVFNYETGYRGSWLGHHLETESDLFYTVVKNIDDDLDYGTSPIDFIGFVNTNQAVARGSELQLKYRFSPTQSAYLNYTYESITDWSGNIGEVTRSTPHHSINLGAQSNLGYGFFGSTNLGYKDAYIIDNLAAERDPHAYWRLDVRLAYALPWYKQAELYLAGQNLLQSDHVEFADGLTVPRTYEGGVRIQFRP